MATLKCPPGFPTHRSADSSGLLAIGGDLSVETLLSAYRYGIFPWPIESDILAWFSPPKRAILSFDELHISKSLRRSRNKNFTFAINTHFEEVINHCAASKRPRQRGTWIIPEMISAYLDFNNAGYATSFECFWEEKLVGGMYGVWIDSFFAGESMFHLVDDASKLALWFAVEHLSARGVTWLDCQMLTPLLKNFGAKEVPRAVFLKMLSQALKD